jgi:hypothetical protein
MAPAFREVAFLNQRSIDDIDSIIDGTPTPRIDIQTWYGLLVQDRGRSCRPQGAWRVAGHGLDRGVRIRLGSAPDKGKLSSRDDSRPESRITPNFLPVHRAREARVVL